MVKLSPRQEEIVMLIGHYGLPNKVVARRLNVSPETVKTHLRQVFVKTGVKHRAELHKLLTTECHPLNAARTLDYLFTFIRRPIVTDKDAALVEFAKDIIQRMTEHGHDIA